MRITLRIPRFFIFLMALRMGSFVAAAPFEASVPGVLTVTGGSGGPTNCGEENPMRWSDPNTWGGTVPAANGSVDIPACEVIILDVATPPLDLLRIEGTLRADSAVDVAITANSIYVMDGGALEIGTPAQPYGHNAIITLTGPRGTHTARTEDNALDNDGLSRSLRIMNGGALRLFGQTPPLLKTKLNAHANAGANSFTLADSVNWRTGDRVAVSLTDFHGVGETEILTLANNTAGTSMNTTSGIQTFRWGRLQYPTDTGLSLTPGTYNPPSPHSPLVLDQRAEVVNLTRRIVIQGADDADWNTQGFGAHVMIMGLNSVAQARGVEFRRVGQRRAMGRYPWHWHMLSYTAANAAGQGGGAYLGDAVTANHFLQDSAIWNSQNRAVTIHGTNGVMVDNVYAVDIKGHAFFFEDGPEQRNTVRNSVAMKVRDPGPTNFLKVHDHDASGFWMTNPNNTIAGNSASDTDGRGLWNSFSERCFGLSRNAAIEPYKTNLLAFDDNTGHSNWLQGLATNFNVIDEAGNLSETRYVPPSREFTMSRNKTWKNKHGGYANRVDQPQYIGWTAADNRRTDFFGATDNGAFMTGTLLVGKSLNDFTSYGGEPRIGLSSYHYALRVTSITAYNYAFAPVSMQGNVAAGEGLFNGSDLYTEAYGVGMAYNVGWKIINSIKGALTPPPYFDGFPLAAGGGFRHWSLPGVTHDVHGYWTQPAGRNLIHVNHPFYTHGLTDLAPIAPNGQNGVSTAHPFYGLASIIRDFEDGTGYGRSMIPLRLGRLDTNNVEFAEHTIGDPNTSIMLGGMRHFTVAKGGRYKLTFPGTFLPTTQLSFGVYSADKVDDELILGVPWPGNIPVAGRIDAGSNYSIPEATRVSNGMTRLLSNSGTSVQSVVNDPTGVTMWQDTANNTVWIKYKGGLIHDATYPPLSLLNLSMGYFVRLRPA